MSDDLARLDEVERELVYKAAELADIRDARNKAAFKRLFTKAKAAAILARNDLVKVNPRDWRTVEMLQNEVKRYEEMADWVRAAFVEGEQVFAQLEAYRGTESSETSAEQD